MSREWEDIMAATAKKYIESMRLQEAKREQEYQDGRIYRLQERNGVLGYFNVHGEQVTSEQYAKMWDWPKKSLGTDGWIWGSKKARASE